MSGPSRLSSRFDEKSAPVGERTEGSRRSSRRATRSRPAARSRQRATWTRIRWEPSDAVAERLSVPVAAVLAVVWAAVLSWLAIGAVLIVAWILGAGGGDIGDVMRLSAVAWLATHLAPLALEEGTMSVLPLALVLLPATFLWRAGHWAARRSGCCTWADAKPMIIAGTAAYATTGLLLSAVSTSEGASVRAWWALLATALVAFIAFSAGLIREAGLASTLTDRLNPRVRALGLAVGLGCMAIIAGGAVLLAVSMMWHFTTALSMVDALSPGLLGNFMLLLLSILYVPNAIVWASSYSTGAGFTFGEGAWITPLSTASEPVPAFPLLAAIPTGAGPALALVMIIPLLAGALMMRCFARSAGNAMPLVAASALRTRLTMAGAVAAIMGVCCLLAGGSLGDGRLAQVGPVAWQCAVFAGLLALVGGWLADAVASMSSRRSHMASEDLD